MHALLRPKCRLTLAAALLALASPHPLSAIKVRFALRIRRYAFRAPHLEFGVQQHTAATGAQKPQREMLLKGTSA